MHLHGKDVDREERVRQSKLFGIQREEGRLKYDADLGIKVAPGAVDDYARYIPIGNAVDKLNGWKQQGATMYYLTSRRVKSEVETIKRILRKFNFPDSNNLFFRKTGEDYKDEAEGLCPDIIIEDDCESIGGEKEMTYPHVRRDLKQKIKSIVVKEFGGIDHIPSYTRSLFSVQR